MPMSTPYQRPTHLDLIVSAQPQPPRPDEARSEERDGETSVHCALNAHVVVVGEFPIEGRTIDAFSEGGGVSTLNEHAKEFRTFLLW